MRTLLVDNYDSFTYNLFHQLAEVNGAAPEVIRNDAPGWRPGMLDAFDNVVLSPGPGTPHTPADTGICAGIVEDARIPVLGVCLGHQALALAHGARVVRAPEPRHGRASAVLHDGAGLFEALPSPLEVIRYHSLVVDTLPPVLEPLARTADGVLMALRHRSLPLWGVQFHPESIGTTGGRQLMANFRRLTEQHGRRRPVPAPGRAGQRTVPVAARVPVPVPAPVTAAIATATATAAAVERAEPRRLRVLAERLATRWDAEVVFDRLFRAGRHPFWLDSGTPPHPALGRLSMMGDATGPLARVATADVRAGTVTVTSAHATRTVRGGFLDWLEEDLRAASVTAPELPFDFTLGWVGYLGYELKADHEGDSAHPSAEPDAVMVFADRAVVLDHSDGATYLLALAEEGDEAAALGWLRESARRLAGLVGLPPEPVGPPAPAGKAGKAGEAPVVLRLRHERDMYLKLIDGCRQEIGAGETYEVCLTNMIETELPGADPWQLYRSLRRISPAPFGAFLGFGEVSVLSTSPERFLRVDRYGTAESRPIKGTRPRGATEADDALAVADLAASEKDRAENLMIVDLVRNDLGRNAVIGSVSAEPVFQVETYASAHQLVSTVRARLRADSGAVAAVRDAFPGGSMTGAPKIRTMRIIDALEGGPRGVYSGAIGYFSLTGAADLSIVIRTAVLHGNRLSYGVGGAIIDLSDPAAEFEETAVKATPLLTLLGASFPGRAEPA